MCHRSWYSRAMLRAGTSTWFGRKTESRAASEGTEEALRIRDNWRGAPWARKGCRFDRRRFATDTRAAANDDERTSTCPWAA